MISQQVAVLAALSVESCRLAAARNPAKRPSPAKRKTISQPVAAWALAVGVFGLHGSRPLDVVVTSALPAAQNLYTYASRYRVAEGLARDSILLSTVVSVPVLVVIAALLG